MLNEVITTEKAIRLLTIDAAYGTFQENVKGSLTNGKFADLVILSDNPLLISKFNLLDINILATVIGGKFEYCNEQFLSYCSQSSPTDSSLTQINSNSSSASEFVTPKSETIQFLTFIFPVLVLTVLILKRKILKT